MSSSVLLQGELQVRVFRLREQLAELGEEEPPEPARARAGGERAQLNALQRQASALEARLAEALDPRRRRRCADAELRFPGDSNVAFLVRRVLRQCGAAEEVEPEFARLRKRAGYFGDPSGRIFSCEELDSARESCSRELLRRAMEESDSGGEDGGEAAASRDAGRPKAKRRGGKGRKEAARQGASPEEDDNEEEADLDGEQAIDLDVGGDESQLGGLVDLFESRQPAAAEDAWGRAWEAPLPQGAWAEATLRGRLQQRGMEVPGDSQSYPAPGHPGFNKYATARLRLAGIGVAPGSGLVDCPPLQPHQQSVAFLLHPCSPIQRMLVDHPTGCGKTREMIQVLDQYFKDPRPKVAIFPTEAVCRNFYAEVLRWPSRYRDFFCCESPEVACRAAGLPEGGDWRQRRGEFWGLSAMKERDVRSACAQLRECLEMQGTFVMGKLRKSRLRRFRQANPGELFPWAPMRALGYTSAGGSNIKLDPETGRPLSSLFKVGFGRPHSNVYDRKIVLMDEVHNLIRTRTRFATQLDVLRSKLASAEDCVIVGFTATPMPDSLAEGRLLLDTFKGDANVGRSDEGFVSSFPFKPRQLFPRSTPEGCATGSVLDDALQSRLCARVVLGGEALLNYDLKARDPEITGRRLQAYCNMFCWGGAFHDGQSGCKSEVMRRPEVLAPKLLAIARAVAAPDTSGQRSKALVLLSRRTGYTAMLELLREHGTRSRPPFDVATMEQLAEFNAVDNLRGERYLVLVADTAECGEGISFKAVRRQFLADVPTSPTVLVQQCGRANRMYGHSDLEPPERTLAIQLFVASLPAWLQGDALSAWCYRACARRGADGAETEAAAKALRARLRKAGVEGLDALRARLDRLGAGSRKAKSRGGPRQAAGERAGEDDEEVAGFVEALGLASGAELAGLSKPLVRAIQVLRSAVGKAEARRAAEASQTEDQRALERLRRASEEFAPALAALRDCAVDRATLAALGLQQWGTRSVLKSHCPAASQGARRRLCGKQSPAALRARRASVAPGPTARRFSLAARAAGPRTPRRDAGAKRPDKRAARLVGERPRSAASAGEEEGSARSASSLAAPPPQAAAASEAGRGRRLRGKQTPAPRARRASIAPGPTARRFSLAARAAGASVAPCGAAGARRPRCDAADVKGRGAGAAQTAREKARASAAAGGERRAASARSTAERKQAAAVSAPGEGRPRLTRRDLDVATPARKRARR